MNEKPSLMQSLHDSSHLGGDSSSYMEELYELYLKKAPNLDSHWVEYFDSLPEGCQFGDVSHAAVQQHFLQSSKIKKSPGSDDLSLEHERKQVGVAEMITSFRARGHLMAKLDPINLERPMPTLDLDLGTFCLSDTDFNVNFDVNNFAGLPKTSRLDEIYRALRHTYCDTLGAEYMHITDINEA